MLKLCIKASNELSHSSRTYMDLSKVLYLPDNLHRSTLDYFLIQSDSLWGAAVVGRCSVSNVPYCRSAYGLQADCFLQ